jgi:hypothetical protein
MRQSHMLITCAVLTCSCGPSDPAEVAHQSRIELIQALGQQEVTVVWATSRPGDFKVQLEDFDWYWRPSSDPGQAQAGLGGWLGVPRDTSPVPVWAFGQKSEELVARYFAALGLDRNRKPPSTW